MSLAGADLSHAPLRNADLGRADLSGAELRNADLRAVLLEKASLRRAKLTGATLDGATFWLSDLTGADLTGALLRGTELFYPALNDADLQDADLELADLRGAKLTGANLAGANLKGAVYDPQTRWPAGCKPEETGAWLEKKRLNIADLTPLPDPVREWAAVTDLLEDYLPYERGLDLMDSILAATIQIVRQGEGNTWEVLCEVDAETLVGADLRSATAHRP